MSTPISAPVKGILDRLQNVRPNGNGRTALCPAHDDRTNSLSVGEGSDGRVLLKCFAGCDATEIVTALRLEMRDLFPRAMKKPGAETRINSGLTLEEYARVKGLPVDFLKELGIGQIYIDRTPAVRIP